MPPLSMYCLWLIPSFTDHEHLSAQIKKLADRSPSGDPSPVFDPHVTFLSGLSLETDVEVLKRDVRQGLKAWSDEMERSLGNEQDESGSSKQNVNSNLNLEMELEEPINGGSFYTAMIYPVKQESTRSSSPNGDQPQTPSNPYDRLLLGRTTLQTLLSRYFPSQPPGSQPNPKPYFPHLSLQYSSLAKSELASVTREFIDEEKSESTLATKVGLDRCALMRLEGEVAEWKVVAVYRLDGEEV